MKITSSVLALTLLLPLLSGSLTPPASAQPAVEIDATLQLDPSRPQGVDDGGHVLMYAPNPLEQGSSVSHWDLSASPDLLMEPSASPLVGFGQLDLTVPALMDLGWPAGTSNLTLRVQDAAGTGFNDSELGNSRRAAMEFVAQRWGQFLGSGVEINLGVSFEELPCSENSGVLAQAGTQFIFEDFPGAPVPNTWFHSALAESLSGQNLSLEDVPGNPDAPDIRATFNSRIDEECLAQGTRFYYGLDGNVPPGQISFVNVALHEVGHGLGFASLTNPQTGNFTEGLPDIFSRFLLDTDLDRRWHQMTLAQRRLSAVNTGGLVWGGSRANSAATDSLDPSIRLQINAPAELVGSFLAAPAQFGPRVTQAGLPGRLALGRDGSDEPTLGCSPLVNGAEAAGRIVLLDRGTCLFVDKVNNAQNAGAIGVVIVNNVAGPPVPLGGDDPGIVIPAVHIAREDGARLKRALSVGLPPAAPSNLAVVPLAGGRSRLTWSDNSDNETVFHVERRRAGGAFQRLANVPANTTSYEDSGLATGETYNYRVRAQNAAGVSPFSNLATLTVAALPPMAPTDLRATTLSDGEVLLTWRDRSDDETRFVVQRRRVARRGGDGLFAFDEEPYTSAAEPAADATTVIVDGLPPGTTFNFRLQAVNGNGASPFTRPAAATTESFETPGPCVEGGPVLCLLDDRFEVQVLFKNQFAEGAPGVGTGVPYSTDSGLYWFFNPSNIELVVKAIDGTPLTGSYWFFYGALTNVEYWITVTDTETGGVRSYHNPPNVLGAEADTRAFVVGDGEGSGAPGDGAQAASHAAGHWLAFDAAQPVVRSGALAGTTTGEGTCQPGPTVLCLFDDRFEVTVTWNDPRSGSSGVGNALPLEGNDTTGTFWFFQPENLELLVKTIDGTSVNGHFWVFFGGLTDLPYTLRVVDTVTGNSKEYENPFGNLVGRTDTEALDPE